MQRKNAWIRKLIRAVWLMALWGAACIATPSLWARGLSAPTTPFTEIPISIPGIGGGGCEFAWGDYDNDGDLDVLLLGYTGIGPISRIYRNDGEGIFTDIGANLANSGGGTVVWGDYDNDGDLDVLSTGFYEWYRSEVYRNEQGQFVAINAGLFPLVNSAADWGDYDNDGDLDILITGEASDYYDNIPT